MFTMRVTFAVSPEDLRALEMSSEIRRVSPWLPSEADRLCQMGTSRSSVKRGDREPYCRSFSSKRSRNDAVSRR